MGKYALLIGVGEYGEGLTPLPAAPRDVVAFADVLQNPQMGGFDEVKPVINPNQAQIAREIELWFQGREPDDLVLLFFSGHGVKDDRRELFFAACNTEKQRDSLIRSTAISAQSIHDCIRRCKAKYQVIILDCCFSGAFGDFLARDDGEINLKEQLGAEGCVVLTATNAVDYAYEEKGADLSIYTRYLVEGIASGAADEDEDGVITVEELHRFAGRKVEATSPAMSPKIITLKDEGYRIRLARSPQDDPKVKYRKEAERRAESGQFSIPARRLLLSLRQKLGILDIEAEAIEAEVLKPFQEYQRKRQEYEETLRQCLQEDATLSPNVIKDLMDFRNHLGLKLEDVVAIEQDCLGLSLENYQSAVDRQREEQAQARHIEKLQRYREGFTKAIEAGYPLNEYVRNGLKQLQQQLELNDEEIFAIEQPIRNLAEAKYQEQLRVREENERKQKEVEQKRQAEAQAQAEREQRYAEALQRHQQELDRQREEDAQALHAKKLQKYREFFTTAIEHEYPLNQRLLVSIKQYQQQLYLSDEDVATIEQPIREYKEAKYQDELRAREENTRKQQAEVKVDDLSSERFGANYYAKLRDLLAAQDWKVADQETAKRMCQVMNPQEDGELLIGDFQKFPCHDLLNIDRLWVKYSNGQFGFSVQKAIYLECGGELLPISSTKSLVKNVERFGDRVGWRAKGIWRYHSGVTSSSFIPKGSFPFVWSRRCNFMSEEDSEGWPLDFISAKQYGRWASPIVSWLQPGKMGICFVILFSHLENCELYLLENN